MASLHAYDTKAGRRYVVRFREGARHRGRTFHRKKDAERFRADVIRRVQLGELYEDDGGTLGTFLDGWLERYALRVRPSSSDRRRAALAALHGLRVSPLAHLSPAQVEDAVTELAARAPRQAELALASLKLALKDAAKRGLRFDRRILDLTSPKSRVRKPTFLDWKQVNKLASWMPNDGYVRFVFIAVLTGLRRGELLALVWGDVDFKAQAISVREGKTEAARRSVDMPLRAKRLLLVHRGRQGDPAKTAPVFPNNRGGHHDPHNFYMRVFRPAAKAADLEGLTLHDLRHTYASLLAAANVNPKVAAGLMGHADGGALFLRRYSHLYPGAGRQAAEALEGIL